MNKLVTENILLICYLHNGGYFMKLDFGTLNFNNENEYYVALGSFCNNKAFTISFEPNKLTGSYSDAYRMRKLATANKLIDPLEKAIRTGNRINSNSYVDNLIKNHNFVQNGKAIYGTLENVIKTVPKKYISEFMKGYTKSATSDNNSIIVYEADNVKATATSLKKTYVPRNTKKTTTSVVNGKKNKTKHDYIKEHIRNTDIGERGEKLVFDMEKAKLLKAVESKKISSIDKLLKWISLEDDSAGYDILSYDIDKKEPIYIEVKTTTGSKLTPFYMSENELEFSKNNENNYRLYRIYNFKKPIAEFFELTGDISKSTEVQIDAVNYLVSIK